MKIKEYVFKIYGNDELTKIVSSQDIEILFDLIVNAAKENKEFMIYELGECVGDYT